MSQCTNDNWLPYLGEGRAQSVCLDRHGSPSCDRKRSSDKNHNSTSYQHRRLTPLPLLALPPSPPSPPSTPFFATSGQQSALNGDVASPVRVDDAVTRQRQQQRRRRRHRDAIWYSCFACGCVQGQGSDATTATHLSASECGNDLEADARALTADAVSEWRESFEKLLKNRAGRSVFGEFLKTEYSEENLLFWSACEDLKQEQNDEKVEDKARAIYDNYISILSPKEVSLDSRVRDLINENMVRPSKKTFDEAQSQIYMLMYRDSYPRFLNSKFFTQLLGCDSYKKVPELST